MTVVLFLHLLGAIAVGFYLLMPFLTGNTENYPALRTMNRVGQYLLIVQFLTGGYLIAKFDSLSVAWMVVSIVLWLAIIALSGIMGKKMKESKVSSVRTLSTIVSIILIVITLLMYKPDLLG